MATGMTMSDATLLRRLSTLLVARSGCPRRMRLFSSYIVRGATFEPPDVSHLADSARISLAPGEVEDFGPKIRQVIDWFGQLQAVDLESVEPSVRADAEVSMHKREDTPETFENREAIIRVAPSYDDPYIKVPKVLSKE
ncbi:glutamyl-tRNA(Gln) amidotransferase subunit C, chloroplastic/mitochondrial-like [Zingiber officinale]|uniref:glutamyl-tRNA(Gln) amidotransferase subunit C, chloroplastic/mitochondrial-like n=1 Tax=Zingiber officinale TaxID=94328 RepID=UPI001C4CC657|nr:glutamyl-tRNA(Gln) amidotransferase subunit C, chloroplastic/mitochondrial-like [Zingiber officinale]